MDLGQFERIERPPTRLRAAPPARPASRLPGGATALGVPGPGWLIGWVVLVWIVLVLAVLPNVSIHRMIGPDGALPRGFPGSEQWIRSTFVWFVRWGAVHATIAAVEGLGLGGVLWLMLRSRIRGARWSPLLCGFGAALGTGIGYGLSTYFTLSDGGSVLTTNLELYLLRHNVVLALVGGAGSAVAMAWVLQRQLPGYGWWAAAWIAAFCSSALPFPTALLLGASSAWAIAASAFIGLPALALITGIATFVALRRLPPADEQLDGPLPSS